MKVQNLLLVRAQQRKSLWRRGRTPPPEHFSQASEQSQKTEESWKKKGEFKNYCEIPLKKDRDRRTLTLLEIILPMTAVFSSISQSDVKDLKF